MYYLYRHIRLDKNEPFYIGVGKVPSSKNDSRYRRANQRAGRNRIWKGITSRTNYNVEILIESDNRDFILEREKEFISIYGRINTKTGILANLTDGGDYFDGFVDTDERKRKIGLAHRGRKKPKEASEKAWITRRKNKTDKPSDAIKEKMRDAKLSNEKRQNILNLLKSGEKIYKICILLKCDYVTVQKIKNKSLCV